MKPLVTIVIPYAYSVKWLQILLTSLKIGSETEGTCKIVVMDNTPLQDRKQWPGTMDVMKNLTIAYAPHPMDWHAGCMDFILPEIDTPYFMMMESDCQVMRPDWLSNFLEPMQKDDLVAMAGWFWPGGDRNYIGPGATIYNTELVKKIRSEVMQDKRKTFCFGDGLARRHTLEPRLAEMIDKGQWGPFGETRGFHDRVSRDDKWWQEPCAWLYYRLQSEYECIRLPGIHLSEIIDGMPVAAGTHYGDARDPFLIHYWGGTASHNWEKQKVTAAWELKALPWWIEREDTLWREVVPDNVRERTLKVGLVKTGPEEMDFILNHPNVKETSK